MVDQEDPLSPPVRRMGPLPGAWQPVTPRTPNLGWSLVVIALGLALACLVTVGVVLRGIQFLGGDSQGSDQAGEIIDQFLQLMKDHHEAEAYDLFSAHARLQTSLDELKHGNSGGGYRLVEGYRRIEIQSFQLDRRAAGANPTTATASGRIFYNQRDPGHFQATLEAEGGDWKLTGIYISPVPDVIGWNESLARKLFIPFSV